MPEATLSSQDALRDPEFLALPEEEMVKGLATIDQDFRGLPPDEQRKVVQHSKRQGQLARPAQPGAPGQPTPPAPPTAAPTSEAVPSVASAPSWSAFKQTAAKAAQDAGVGLQLSAASIAKGLTYTLGAPSDIAELAVNGLMHYSSLGAVGDLAKKATGVTPEASKQALGSPEFPGGQQDLEQWLPDSLKVPKDLPFSQRILTGAIEWQAMALAPTAAAVKLLSFANPQHIMQLEAKIAAVGGVTAETVKEVLGDSPTSEFIGSLAGSLGPQGLLKILSKARQLASQVFGIVSDEKLKEEIGGQLNKMTTPEAIEKGQKESQQLSEQSVKEGGRALKPTTAQASQSPALIQSERGFARAGGSAVAGKLSDLGEENYKVVTDFIRRGAPDGKIDETVRALESVFTRDVALIDASLMRADARIDAAKQTVSATTERIISQADERAHRAETMAQDRINALRPQITKMQAGRVLRDEYDKELAAFNTVAEQRYAEVPNFAFTPTALQQSIAQIKADWSVKIQGPAEAGLRKLETVMGDPENPVTTFKELHAARTAIRHLRNNAIGAHDFMSAYQLGQLNNAVADTMDLLKVGHRTGDTAIQKLAEVDEWYSKNVARLKSGEINALRYKDKMGSFTTRTEDVAGKFLAGETPINEFMEAIGNRPEAVDALRSFAKHDFLGKTLYPDFHKQAGTIDPVAAGRWFKQHEAALAKFPELKQELQTAVVTKQTAAEYRAEVDAIEKQMQRDPVYATRLRNPKVTEELDEATREQARLLELKDRTIKDWERSKASDVLGLDADYVGKSIVRSTGNVRTQIADISKRIGTNPDAQRGFDRILWDAALDKASTSRVDAMGNLKMTSQSMLKFLKSNEPWMLERFGAERVERMRTGARELQKLEGTGSPVLPGGSDTVANFTTTMVDWGPFFSRLYAEASGRIGTAWLVSERIGRIAGKMLKGREERFVTDLLEEAFFNPEIAKTWMLAARNASEAELAGRLKSHIATKAGYGGHIVSDFMNSEAQ